MQALKNFFQFVKDAREELKKVTWPTRDEVTRFTGVVVATVFVVSLFLFAIDFSLETLIKYVMK
jgi:preprotein translocase subunit SecE